jgi:hypothetical protein
MARHSHKKRKHKRMTKRQRVEQGGLLRLRKRERKKELRKTGVPKMDVFVEGKVC